MLSHIVDLAGLAAMDDHVLEPAAQRIADATAQPPYLYDLDEKWITVPAAVGDVAVRIVKPVGAAGLELPTVLYVHGGGWVLGNAGTHDRLVRELAVGAHAAVVFVEYDRAPEAQYPVAIEQAYATAQWITRDGITEGLDHTRLAVVGDSVGGNMAAALTILAKQRGDVTFVHQSLYYPVADAAQDTDSYRQFAHGPYLRAQSMAWFWDSYLPHWEQRAERDEGEAHARKLTAAGVPTTCVRYNGTLHDFMMLNPLRGTAATTRALEQASHVLRGALARR